MSSTRKEVMVLIGILVLLGMIILICLWMDLIEAVFFFGVFSVVILAITIFLNAGVYVNQVGDIESIKRLESNKVLLKQKSDILTKEFKTYLGEKYPDLEERIFSKMSATAAQVYLVQYPELQSSKVFINLVAEIKDLQKDIFNQDLEIQKKQKDIRVRDRNPFYLTFLIPNS